MINLLRSASRVSAVLAMLMYFNTFRLLRSCEARPAIARDDFFISARVMRRLILLCGLLLAACRTFPLAGRIAHRSWNLTV